MSTQETYINLLTDFGFKKLFGVEANKDLLIDFLNQILPKHHQIKNLTYEKNEQLGKNIKERKAFYDLYCMSKTGERFIVELQKTKQDFYKDRCLFYSTFPIQAQAQKGDWNFELKAVYTISIMDFCLENNEEGEEYIHTIKLKDQNGQVFYDKLSYIYVELPKFKKDIEELETRFEKWLFVFRWINELKERPKALQERVFKKLFSLAKIANLSEMERLEYDRSLKAHRDIVNSLDYAKKEVFLEVIKNGLETGFSLEQISSYTKLSTEQIQDLITKYNLAQE